MPCTITALPRKSALTVAVVGHCAARLPRLVEREAARIATGGAKAPLLLVAPEGRFLLLKPEDKPWLVGGEAWRLLGKQVVDGLRSAKLDSASILLAGRNADPAALACGCLLADYRFDRLRSGKDKRNPLAISIPGHPEAVAAGVRLAEAQNLARELGDEPPNLLNPATYAARVRRTCARLHLPCTVISGLAALRRARFPGLVQVGQAGSTEPALVTISYRPRRPTRKGVHLALVGKGLTFDSGGLSLKPGDKMWEMKGDMAGSAAVFATMTHLAASRPGIPVTAYLCLAENLPDSRAQRPGDIYLARNGKSVHVDNTDAEGRLVLADALSYAAERGATHIVDVATLTGACVVALGEGIAGAMGRDEAFVQTLRAAGQEAGEEFWPLPLYGEYRSLLDHPHADLNNIGGRWAGAVTAGLFLAEFVPPEVKWAHLDIAGPAIRTGGWRCYAKGCTGFATRTLIGLAHRMGG